MVAVVVVARLLLAAVAAAAASITRFQHAAHVRRSGYGPDRVLYKRGILLLLLLLRNRREPITRKTRGIGLPRFRTVILLLLLFPLFFFVIFFFNRPHSRPLSSKQGTSRPRVPLAGVRNRLVAYARRAIYSSRVFDGSDPGSSVHVYFDFAINNSAVKVLFCYLPRLFGTYEQTPFCNWFPFVERFR